uniref:TetR/AcrR family transcriptional regulator n=1 Tax=Micromonospora carbonacea TaxID=47853 RepID=A0A7D5Y509_9ACTN|nr:TetR/AcrR family transcriptional regulator [Micromonospora carbonacea]
MPASWQDPPTVTERPTRSDARRNYDRLVAAANLVFAEHGTDASLDEIAKRAGVGSGTLYRHFPTKDRLMTAVFWERVRALCERGNELAGTMSPLEALVTWLRLLIDLTMRRGLATALMTQGSDRTSELFHACHEALNATAGPLLANAQQDGAIRPDLRLADLIQLCHAIASAVERSPTAKADADRMLDLLIGGLRAHAGTVS